MSDDSVTFTEFVERHQASLVRLCWALTGDRQLGEDLAQVSLARLWPRWETVSIAGDRWRYLQRIAVSQASSRRRRRWHDEIPSAAIVETVDRFDGFASVHATDRIERWLTLLPARQRAVVVLRFLFDLSVEETSDRLRCSPGTVKSQTAKALATLRSHADIAHDPTGAEPQ